MNAKALNFTQTEIDSRCAISSLVCIRFDTVDCV